LRTVNSLPARICDGLPLSIKRVLSDGECQIHFLIAAGRGEHREEAPHHEVIDVAFLRREGREIGRLLCGDDSMVVGHLLIVDDRLRGDRLCAQDGTGIGRIGAGHDPTQPLREGRHDVVGNIAGIRARIGQKLVGFIEPLHDRECLLGGIGVFFVGVPLELRQVVGGGWRQFF